MNPANTYYYDYIHDQNKEIFSKQQNQKSHLEKDFLLYDEIIEDRKDHKKRVNYYINALPDEKDFSLGKNIEKDIMKLKRYD